MSDEQYESKVAALLKSAHERDAAAGANVLWKNAYAKPNEGDHCIAVMLDQALGGTLRKHWWSWW